MKISYFSTAIDNNTYNRIVESCKKYKPTYSGINFDRKIGLGVSKYAELIFCSLQSVPSYPKYNLLTRKVQSMIGKSKLYAPGFINLPMFKTIIFFLKASYFFMKASNKGNVVLISGLYTPFLLTSFLLKIFTRKKVICIVPDLPEIMLNYRKDKSILNKMAQRIFLKLNMTIRSHIDGYIFLTPYMNIINKKNKDYICIDGLVDTNDYLLSTEEILMYKQKYSSILDDKSFVIMYAGKITEKFGISLLIKSFIEASIEKSLLILHGDGDYAKFVIDNYSDNENIYYGGLVKNSEILFLENEVDLLVDPRPGDDILAKMSFPSKVHEYLFSGKPVLVNNLPCYTTEYEKYLFMTKDNSIDSWKNSMIEISKIDQSVLNEIKDSNRNFIKERKNIDIQSKEIISFINNVVKR